MKYQDFCASFLPHLKNSFLVILDENSSNDQKVVLRSTISSGIEVETFINKFSDISNTKWIVRLNRPHLSKFVYRKTWICQFSSRRKTSTSSRDLKCCARISVTIKKLTEHTKRRDKFLAMSVPFGCIIMIDLNHTHPSNSVDTLKKMRVTDEVQNQYFSYFRDGLTAMSAKRHHENMILTTNNYLIDLANSAKNPSDRQVYYLYDKWQKMNFKTEANLSDKLLQNNHQYEEETVSENGLKRRNLKKTAIPSVNLPASSECTDEYERSVKLKKTKKSRLKEETPVNKIIIEDPKKDTCFPDEMDSQELSKSLEEMKNGISLNSDEEHMEMENIEMKNEISSNSTNNEREKCLNKSPSSTEFSIKVPKYSDIENISVNLRKSNKNNITQPSTVKEHSIFDFSLSPSDSKERLTQKLENALSVNAALQQKLEFYQNKCKTYEKEVKILRGVIDNLKLINSVASDY